MKKILPLAAIVAIAATFISLQVATARPAHSAAAKRAVLGLRTTKLGRFVVDGRGRTLYLFMKDSSRRSACSGACAHNWPPYITSGKPRVGAGLSASKAGTIRRSNGSLQATYGGHPLYRFSGDRAPGDTHGQGLNAFGANWYVIKANGQKIDND